MGVLGMVQDIQNNQIHKDIMSSTTHCVNRRKSCKTIIEKNETNEDATVFNSDNDNLTEKDILTNGWIRIYCGPDRSDLITIEPSRMVHCNSITTVSYIVKELNLPDEYTLWIQTGGSNAQRLNETDRPFKIQDDIYKKLGYINSSRRSRLEIDPEMKYLLRFYIGPSDIPICKGVKKSGMVDVLKGLVFPQWKKRYIAIIGNKLFLYPANSYTGPELFDLSESDIIEHSPSYDRLILKIIPKIICENKNFYLKDNNKLNYKNCSDLLNVNNNNNCINNRVSGNAANNNNNNNNNNHNNNNVSMLNSNVYNSSSSINSFCEREKVLFLGFEESWERDLWSAWLLEATTETNEPKKLDIGNSGLQTIPEIILQSIGNDIQELSAGQNKLQEIGLKALSQFPQLQILRLSGNGFKCFPTSLLSITQLTVLDLADNSIDRIPGEIYHLELLEELRLDRNEITELSNTLRLLRNLKFLYVSQNRILKLPPFLIKMRTMGLVDMYSQKAGDSKVLNNHLSPQQNRDKNNLNPPLTKINLRANCLKGNIILGNYGNLTQLDISENEIETLDLSALGQLESLQCCRNKLVELVVNGGLLTTLIAGNNELRKLSIAPAPVHLKHLDISYNKLKELPQWLNRCNQLRTLFANNNQLQNLPEHLFCSELNSLHTLQLSYNELITIPAIPDRKLPLQEIFLQCNCIESLPENFFNACENLIILNVSSNKLTKLPSSAGCSSQLERLYATKNNLNDNVLKTLIGFKNLRTFHAAYNELTIFPAECIQNWPELEELVLSGNKLRYVPDNLSTLAQLKVLRLHSNKLQSVPPLATTTTLRVLDLAHNQLDKINLVQLVPKKLQFLDLSCNLQLQVDPQQLQACRSQRPMSLVDVSGKNRPSLPTTPDSHQESSEIETPWKVGFSETAGGTSKLYIAQLRLSNFCNTEGLFGMFDGELNSVVPNVLVKVIPKILLEERAVKETANEYMKYTLLSAHRELRNNGQKHGVSATLCHISREKVTTDLISSGNQGRRFILRVASVGETSAFLLRKTTNVKLTPKTPNRQIGNSASFPLVVPDPEICEVTLGEQDEYLVICNKKLWEIMDIDYLSKEIRNEENVILSAKRIQDIAQSFGAEENLSIILVRFNNLGTDVDFLIRELRQTVRRKSSGIMSNFCKCGCCCESNNSCCHSAGSTQFIRQFSGRSDRSSPSGQSDHAGNEVNHVKANVEVVTSMTSRKPTSHVTNEKRSLRGGVARAVRAKIEEEKEKEIDDTDSALSEEQFKCWEYMLEQNTQLLFDKELNTISRAFTKNKNADKNNSVNNSNNLLKSQNNRALSASSPQLIYGDLNCNPQYNGSFLSKHFGSARSFQPPTPNLFKSMRFNSGRLPPIGGGPNAAYFGSLQRLMPYNLEYDFAVMHERNTQDDSLENEARMRQYWGVATTEL